MGMDVMGVKPASKRGEYFYNNVWWWSPLWAYCRKVAPDIAMKVNDGFSNDGDGLDAEDAAALGRVLNAEVESGETKRFQEWFEGYLAAIPDEECKLCHGTGERHDEVIDGKCAYSTQTDQRKRPHADHRFRPCRSPSERSDAQVGT